MSQIKNDIVLSRCLNYLDGMMYPVSKTLTPELKNKILRMHHKIYDMVCFQISEVVEKTL